MQLGAVVGSAPPGSLHSLLEDSFGIRGGVRTWWWPPVRAPLRWPGVLFVRGALACGTDGGMTDFDATSMNVLAATALREAMLTLAEARDLAKAATADAAGRAAVLVGAAQAYLDVYGAAAPGTPVE